MTLQLTELSSNRPLDISPPPGIRIRSPEAAAENPFAVWHQDIRPGNVLILDPWPIITVSLQMGSDETESKVVRGPLDMDRGPKSGLGSHQFIAIARELISREQITAARRILKTLLPEHVDESARRLMAVLEEPVLRQPRPARSGTSDEMQWLRHHSAEHHGRWVALIGSDLIDSDANLTAMVSRLRNQQLSKSPFLHRC